MGVANQYSIATGIAKILRAMGAELAFSYLPDTTGKMAHRVHKAIDVCSPSCVLACDVTDDQRIEEFFSQVHEKIGTIDFLVHSIAFAPLEDLKKPTLETSRHGFLEAMNISVYSLIACARAAKNIMPYGGSIVTMSYYGGEKVVPGYNVMGVAKSALESSVRYLAYDLGSSQIRINAISAGPVKTLASSAFGVSKMLDRHARLSPLQKNITSAEIGHSAAYLLGPLSTSTTGEILHVDAGYHAMGLAMPEENSP